MHSSVKVISHPLIQHKLSLLRDKTASVAKVRALVKEISILMGYEVTRNMPLVNKTIETPFASMSTLVAAPKKTAFVSIMRAGQGMISGLTELLPTAHIGHIGLFRERKTNSVIEYFFKMPPDIFEREVIVVDCLIAGGHSAACAVTRLKGLQPKSLSFLCLLASKPGLDYFCTEHPDVPVYTAGVDPSLNEGGYIVPGIGDISDRLFGTL